VTGLGHVEDLAIAMAQIIGRDHCKGQIYNIQDKQSVSFEGLAKLCGEAMGKEKIDIKYYDKKMFDFGDKKSFPMREQHFFCSSKRKCFFFCSIDPYMHTYRHTYIIIDIDWLID